MEKIKNKVVIGGLILLFSWAFGLAIAETIQNNIKNYPDSYQWYQLILNVTHAEKVIAPLLVFLWAIGTVAYLLHKIR